MTEDEGQLIDKRAKDGRRAAKVRGAHEGSPAEVLRYLLIGTSRATDFGSAAFSFLGELQCCPRSTPFLATEIHALGSYAYAYMAADQLGCSAPTPTDCHAGGRGSLQAHLLTRQPLR
jgi:hypothetical protein